MSQEFVLTIAVFYWGYLAVIAVFAVASLINIYHLLRFGSRSLLNWAVVLIYVLAALSLISYSLTWLSGVDFNQELFNPQWFNNAFSLISGPAKSQ